MVWCLIEHKEKLILLLEEFMLLSMALEVQVSFFILILVNALCMPVIPFIHLRLSSFGM